MKITRTSPISGIATTLELDVSEAQIELYKTGKVHIQYCFPNLSDSDREFILTGITEKEWEEAFPEE